MIKPLLRTLISVIIAYMIFNYTHGFVIGLLPSLPFGLSGAIVLAILVLIIDYILQTVAHLK